MTDDWLQAYFAEVGREIDNASTQLHETTNWSIGVVMAAVSAVAVAPGEYPNRWTLAAVAVAWVLTVRFFVRSCIAYSYLARWNKIHRSIVRIKLLSGDGKRAEYEEELKQAIDIYHVQWKSATRLPALVFSNLKLGYLQLFVVNLALLAYGLLKSDCADWVTWTVVVVVLVDLVYEYWSFPSKTYLEFKGITKTS